MNVERQGWGLYLAVSSLIFTILAVLKLGYPTSTLQIYDRRADWSLDVQSIRKIKKKTPLSRLTTYTSISSFRQFNCKLSELRCELSKNYLPQVFQQFNSSFDFLRTTLIPNPTFVGISAPDHSFYFVVVLWCHGPLPSI